MKFYSLIFLLTLFSCSKNVLKTSPSCIVKKINAFKDQPKGNPPQLVVQYTYHGKKVFYIPAQCCDQYSSVYDDNCNLLGHPDGGYTGKGDGTLPGFLDEASNPKTIWKDDR